MIEFHDPTGASPAAGEDYDHTFDLTDHGSATIGLLANGFADSERFLDYWAMPYRNATPILRLRFGTRVMRPLLHRNLCCRSCVTNVMR
ncbi:MAG: hypothetical protein CM15mP120_02730 [Pseudomonadota bacterium]|nr:MAG: hypothetical protein CM15mP120_02730 [Pseudomonadota bacterium]